MSGFLSTIKDKLIGTSYQNASEAGQIDIKDDSLVVNLLSKFILPILLIFGFYVHTHGDYTPGGGFQAGIIFACAVCLYYFINLNNNNTSKRFSHLALSCIAYIGFILYVGFGVLCMIKTGNFLDFSWLPFKHANGRGVFIVESGIALIVFSSVTRTFTALLNVLKDIK